MPPGTYVNEESRVLLSEENGALIIADMEDVFITRHVIPAGKGNLTINKNHRRDRSSSIDQIRETVESLFINKDEINVF